MFVAAVVGLLVAMLFALVRAFRGPTIYDTILSVNVFGTKTVLLIAVFGFLMGRPDFLDIALVYALINFVGVVAVLRFFEYTHGDRSNDNLSTESAKCSATEATANNDAVEGCTPLDNNGSAPNDTQVSP